jgi:hypothetical protein
MRRWLLALGLATASGALAAPPPRSLDWADWVGDWSGKLEWTSCSAEGEPRATLAVDAIDGALAIDLTPAGGALGKMPLVEDGSEWAGQQGDVNVRLRRGKTDLEVAVTLDSGCEVKGTLARATTGIRECDRLAAWARIESQCKKLARPPLENAARLARQRRTWAKSNGDARSKLAEQCTARSAKVEAELVDAGCAPHPDPAIGMRGAECQALRGAAARLARCGNVPFDLREALAREVVVLVAAAQGADKESLPVVDAECRRTREKLVSVAQQAGCPP